jgi:ElaB/YqjD/DUF883 family membrane-anchored ribosome-binding protein
MNDYEGELRDTEAPSQFDRSNIDASRPTGFADTQSGASTADQAKDAFGSAKEQTDRVIDSASTKASEIGDKATQQADAGMEKAASGLDSLAGTLRDRGQSMGEGQLQSATTMAADKLESGAEMLRQKDTDELVADLEALVRRRPVESMVVAAAAGFFLSKALR